MNRYQSVAFIVSAACAFSMPQSMAGAFIGAGDSNPDLILHPSGYVPGNQNLEVGVCISPSSNVTTDLVIPLQNVIATYNALLPTTGNLFLGGSNNIPSGQLDAESVVLHEVGHCIGLAHVNLATESGLSGSNREYTKSTQGPDNSYDLNDGVDNVKGSSDDLRDDDLNLHWFKIVDNNPFTLAGTIDATTYSRNLADLPSGTYAANASRDLAPLLGVPGTEAVMQQGQFTDEAQRTLTADGVATLLYGAAGVDEIAGTSDDYTITLVYRGITSSDCDVTVTVDNNTGFAQCEVGFQGVSGDHFRISSGTVRLNQNTNWFYNQVPVDPINMAPEIVNLEDLTTNENSPVSLALAATDPDETDTLSFSAPGAPGFCQISDNGDGTGDLNCSPLPGDAGLYSITVVVADNGDPIGTDETSFDLNVLPEGIGLISQCSTPIASIPDNTGSALTSTIALAESRQVVDMNIGVVISHPFVSDLVVTATHVDSGVSTVLLDRAGIPASANGCDGMDIDALFDDEGSDGDAESTCQSASPAIEGSLTPEEALDAFDGVIAGGDWEISVRDDAAGDSGILFQWCIDATVTDVVDVDSDGDGVFDAVDNCTDVANPDQDDSNGDGIGTRCDTDYDNNCIVNFIDVVQFSAAFNSSAGDANFDADIDTDGSGSINFLDFLTLQGSFLLPPGPSANACVPAAD